MRSTASSTSFGTGLLDVRLRHGVRRRRSSSTTSSASRSANGSASSRCSRSIGANGSQVRRLIVVEALVVSVDRHDRSAIVRRASVVARASSSDCSTRRAPASPTSAMKLLPRTVARRRDRRHRRHAAVGPRSRLAGLREIPPVAAMRPESGSPRSAPAAAWSAVRSSPASASRSSWSDCSSGRAAASGLAVFAGGGALLTFLGVTSLSATVARPVSRCDRQRRSSDCSEHRASSPATTRSRSPRRTARTASALMIGVALISAAAVFASSLRDTFGRILDRAITADYIISRRLIPGPAPGRRRHPRRRSPELSAVSPFRFICGTIGDDERADHGDRPGRPSPSSPTST